jgi:2-oxoglutarate dehydrogenase E1 component
MDLWRDFHGPNAAYVLDLYERYCQDPQAVDATTRAIFRHWQPAVNGSVSTPSPAIEQVMGAVQLAQAIREYGYLEAQLDPLGSPPPGDPALTLAPYGMTEEVLRQLPASLIGGPIAGRAANALDAIRQLRAVYAATTGHDYAHIRVPEERAWLRQAAETCQFWPPAAPIDLPALLERLTQVEVFECFLHRIFPGKTRFSLEGLDILVPILDEVIGEAAEAGMRHILLGMAHRGRLNVLAHVLNKPYAQILAEFKDPVQARNLRTDLGWTGDVKYHTGARWAMPDGEPIALVVTLAPNPSHLEAINPVVEGMARAAGTAVDTLGPPHFTATTMLPILIHGDAAFPGQGIVAETLNLSRLPGYHTGGTLHIIANNQLGYTTDATAARSTLCASDVAKGFEIPIVHVNADDPQACLAAARLAFAYRARFHKDFLLDVVGYRRHGHNEGDEPSFTQPLLYQHIARHPSLREQWASLLVERSLISPEWPAELVRRHMTHLHSILESLQPETALPEPPLPPLASAPTLSTAVAVQRLRQLNEALLRLPDGFALHPKLQRARQRRQTLLDDAEALTIDWATAEELAFASILADGIAIRLTGEDVERGTFSQRHAVLHDVNTGATFIPLQALPQARAAFEVWNSPLSENAAVGFEYGYNAQEPGRLVIWEAQYGDFINGAQVMLDAFVLSARAKWGQTPSLVLLLPHGAEGQGPDHSSAQLERFLLLALDANVRIANCTTAAQYFHVLRRQAALLQTAPVPLLVLTPKSLLRHARVASAWRDLAEGSWHPTLDDAAAQQHPEAVRRLLLCSGKIAVDLLSSRQRHPSPAIAMARVEQLCPFPHEALHAVLAGYPQLAEVVWVQEEPENMGAWGYMQPRLRALIDGRWPLHYLGRPPSPSAAEGSAAWHTVNQAALLEQACTLDASPGQAGTVWLKQT